MKVLAVTESAEEEPIEVVEEEEPVSILASEGVVLDKEEPARLTSGVTDVYLDTINKVLARLPLGALLEWCTKSLPNFFQVTSFGSAGMVIINEIHKLKLKVPAIFLNTLHHFPETLEHARAVEKKYNIAVHWYRCPQAETKEEFASVFKSDDMWISHPRRYEYLTKVEPLERALAEHKVGAWITGRRRDQGGLRTELPILELDVDGRIKVNPLAHWTRQEVWDYLNREGVPYNPLFDKSYTSIGDSVNTTTNNDPTSGERSNRFHQFGGKKTECGIHIRRAPNQALDAASPLPDLVNLSISGQTTN